ncbi:MAG: AbrB/MazE/SpoVT family DNA-binding domain-containing protein [Defluviitaleaceae bacterium]|nr:AbrB/MazE/SpoVT family DNA-binding domain-containing protein [Defluviitaleaceae bacterium]
MERYSARTIDELGKIAFHIELRERLGLEVGSGLSLKPLDNILILQVETKNDDPTQYFEAKVDEIGRITLPKELRETLGWHIKSKIAVYYVDDGMLIFKCATMSA